MTTNPTPEQKENVRSWKSELCVHSIQTLKTDCCRCQVLREQDIRRDERKKIAEAVSEIRALASWHADYDADPADQSPEDQTAHINGLILQACDRLDADDA